MASACALTLVLVPEGTSTVTNTVSEDTFLRVVCNVQENMQCRVFK